MIVKEAGDTFTCDCGFSWLRGKSGAHDCSYGYRKQIAELREKLANIAPSHMGIQFTEPDADAMGTEVWIGEGVIAGENGAPDYHGLIAHDAEYPEEGAIALEDISK